MLLRKSADRRPSGFVEPCRPSSPRPAPILRPRGGCSCRTAQRPIFGAIRRLRRPRSIAVSIAKSACRTLAKGDIVFMDNLRTHKVDGVGEALRAVGATVRYLPAYSPDLNPIEMAFSKLKAALRKGAKRTVKELWRLIGKLVKSFVPDQCANYFRHAGYRR